MAEPADRYEQAYAAKLWQLVPAAYRTLDGPALDQSGPLQELLNRIAAQVAVVRRSIDRLWEDQSIETCDDWVIPYLADLLATNLVSSMDARGQRLDVANTIDYRRRKGTIGLLEQLAADVTGWDARVVEFFRCLGRRRHGLDPEIGWPADSDDPPAARRLQLAEGLVGALSGTLRGGTADLRNPLGASEIGTAYDEYFHRVDVRLGRGRTGWYGIPKLGVFLWRAASLAVDRATPVLACHDPDPTHPFDYYTFDPTGRQVALWAQASRSAGSYGEAWVSPEEWQLPGPIGHLLYDAIADAHLALAPTGAYPNPSASLYPSSLSVSPLGSPTALPEGEVGIWPEVGRFAVPTAGGPVECAYHYGLFAKVGAGPYDRRRRRVPVPTDPLPVATVSGGSASTLKATLAAFPGEGSIVITDGLTVTAVAPFGTPGDPVTNAVLRAADKGRAVIRFDASSDPSWVIEGTPGSADPAAILRLEGLLLTGQDIVLRGGFTSVVLSCCSFDPGTRGDLRVPPTLWGASADGRDLRPTTLWIEGGTVERLVIDRCILGPVRTRKTGVVKLLSAGDSIFQGLPTSAGMLLGAADIKDPDGLVTKLTRVPGAPARRDALSRYLWSRLSPATQTGIDKHAAGTPVDQRVLTALVNDLNVVLSGPLLWDPARFAGHPIRPSTLSQVGKLLTSQQLLSLNRELLSEGYPKELCDLALAFEQGQTDLSRCSVLGAAHVHRLECSESILDGVVDVEDAQDGCVRFSAWATESVLPRTYESVEIPPNGPIFETRRFGEAGYAQLLDGVDAAIVGGAPGATISAGAHNGSEMGAFSAAGAPVKERGLLIKLQEFMPIGLMPIIIHVPGPDTDGERKRAQPWPPT